jgi:glycosyltransferase involved in cell wall biosynthesis
VTRALFDGEAPACGKMRGRRWRNPRPEISVMTLCKLRLAIVTTHPIQYYAPVFRALAQQEALELRVFYTAAQAANEKRHDPGFGRAVEWDIPVLDGYPHEFVANGAERPRSDRFPWPADPKLNAAIAAWQADALLVYGWNAHGHLGVLRYFKGRVPIFFRGDSTLLDPLPWWRRVFRRALLTWVYRHVDVAIAVGSNNGDYYRWCGLSPERIESVPHSVDTARFAADEAEQTARAARLRDGFGIAADATVFLFAGKFQAKKSPDLLIAAFVQLLVGPGAGLPLHLVLVGNGELEPALKARAAAEPRIHFLPFQNQTAMPAVYRLGDVFILPSGGPGETWGLALNEAMASGRPIIASSRVGGARDLVEPGKTGWTFDAGDRDRLVAALAEAASAQRESLRRMGEHARIASTQWSTEACARRIGAIIQSRIAVC